MRIISLVKRFLCKHENDILMIGSIVGVVGTIYLSSKAAIKAYNDKDTLFTNPDSDNKIKTTINTIRPYVPVLVIGTLTSVSIVGSNVLNKRRQAYLISLYFGLNERFKQYREKMIEFYGGEADSKIVKSISDDEIVKRKQRMIYKSSISGSENLESLIREDTMLFYDSISSRYFESTPLIVYSAEYNLCRQFITFGYVDVNTFYSLLGIDETERGKEVGWSMEFGMDWISFSHIRTVMDDGLTCITITPHLYPYPEYQEKALNTV